MDVQDHLKLLGARVQDKVTMAEGVVVSVSFAISGRVQAYLARGFDKDGKRREGFWVDDKRLVVRSKKPLVEQPDFVVIPGGQNLPAPPSQAQK